jgi:molecular chaperone GrpE
MDEDKKNLEKESDASQEAEDKARAAASEDVTALEALLAAKEQESAENLAGWQRAKADFINYKSEQERLMGELRKYANLNVFSDLLPTVDSFDLALKHMPAELEGSDWVKGVMCIKGLFDNFLRDAGVAAITSLGQKFDPYRHEAVGEEISDKEEGTIVEEIQRGYMLGERVLRPARVKVAKRKE